jgi:two-component sensor histidine kinase
LKSTTVGSIATILEEAVTNAVRHGQASNVFIEIRETRNGNISLQVTDNGTGLKSSYSGLGTGLITSICGSHWSISNNENEIGAKLLAEIPII